MQKIDRTRRKRRYLALSFAVPFGVMLLCFVLGGLWPVSYTHLDVYKRQDRCHIGIGKRLLREARVQSACLLRTAAISGLRIKKHILHTVLSPFGIFKEPLIKLQERSARDFVPN